MKLQTEIIRFAKKCAVLPPSMVVHLRPQVCARARGFIPRVLLKPIAVSPPLNDSRISPRPERRHSKVEEDSSRLYHPESRGLASSVRQSAESVARTEGRRPQSERETSETLKWRPTWLFLHYVEQVSWLRDSDLVLQAGSMWCATADQGTSSAIIMRRSDTLSEADTWPAFCVPRCARRGHLDPRAAADGELFLKPGEDLLCILSESAPFAAARSSEPRGGIPRRTRRVQHDGPSVADPAGPVLHVALSAQHNRTLVVSCVSRASSSWQLLRHGLFLRQWDAELSVT